MTPSAVAIVLLVASAVAAVASACVCLCVTCSRLKPRQSPLLVWLRGGGA